jgi:hypothetical protein
LRVRKSEIKKGGKIIDVKGGVPIENCIKGKLYRLSVEELRN